MELKNTRYEISDIGVATVWFHVLSVPNTRTWDLTWAFRRLWHQAATVQRARSAVLRSPVTGHSPLTGCDAGSSLIER